MSNKKLFDKMWILICKLPEIEDFIFLYDIKLKTSYFIKLCYCWLGLYYIRDKNIILDIYWLKKLNDIFFQLTFNDNKLKKFFLCPDSETIRIKKDEKKREKKTENEKTEENVILSQLKRKLYNSSANEQQWISLNKNFAIIMSSLIAHFNN